MKKNLSILMLVILCASLATYGQQVADTSYCPVIIKPAYAAGTGPVVFIDEGHNNFHTMGGRYKPFAMLVERDGYGVRPCTGTFTAASLGSCRILVISNALNEFNVQRWYKPVLPAFTPDEVETVRQWVNNGGSLFLIADHMPMGGAAKNLAAAFDFSFTDGFALDTLHPGPAFFYRADNTLPDNIITDGRNATERVDSIASFTGQAFQLPAEATSILKLSPGYKLMLSDTAWVFDSTTKYTDIAGWSQAAYRNYGKGRVVVCGEAAMFSAQLAGPQKIPAGMNSPVAKHNYQLLLNIMHWLDGLMK
jgi:hypothetical protein